MKQLITDLGGVEAVAAALQVSQGSVRNWQLEGRAVPWRFRPAVAEMARAKGVSLPEGFLPGIAA